jgi:hypothetical protein
MREIHGEAKTIRQLLSGRKYSVDYYQREYKWQTKQAVELLQDLAGKFLNDFAPGHDRATVSDYGHYFLGSIIISEKKGQSFIIDGQQRLTTLTLLLIYLHNLQRDRPDRVGIDDLIFSEKYAKKSFNLDVEQRTVCMEALFNAQPSDPTDRPESVRNIVATPTSSSTSSTSSLGRRCRTSSTGSWRTFTWWRSRRTRTKTRTRSSKR